MTIFGGTWTCHVCGDERPDELIAVHSETYPILGGRVDYTVNVRYCADRVGCQAGAPMVAKRWAAPALDRSPA